LAKTAMKRTSEVGWFCTIRLLRSTMHGSGNGKEKREKRQTEVPPGNYHENKEHYEMNYTVGDMDIIRRTKVVKEERQD
jgi:hypothetical protein